MNKVHIICLSLSVLVFSGMPNAVTAEPHGDGAIGGGSPVNTGNVNTGNDSASNGRLRMPAGQNNDSAERALKSERERGLGSERNAYRNQQRNSLGTNTGSSNSGSTKADKQMDTMSGSANQNNSAAARPVTGAQR